MKKDTTVISIHDATLKTVNIAVRAMTISDKQVTLAVYRQIVEWPLIDLDTMTLNGVPWGYVNVHDAGCKRLSDHFHVVWQLGDELRRDIVRPSPWLYGISGHYRREDLADARDRLNSLLVALNTLPQLFVAV